MTVTSSQRSRRQLLIVRIAMLLFFPLVSYFLFLSTYHRDFSSDDYCILHFLFQEDGYLVNNFFRPVGDLTLKWTYEIFGWSPRHFFTGNALLHGVNAWLLYVLAEYMARDEKQSRSFAFAAGVIFLFYHSTGEVVLWTIGRGIGLAVTFSLMCFIVVVADINRYLKYLLAGVFYFIAISAYESVILLPLVILLYARIKRINISLPALTGWFGVSLLTNLFVRWLLVGKVWAGYTGKIFAKDADEYLMAFAKVIARVFVPSFDRPIVFAVTSLVVIAGLTWLMSRNKFTHSRKIFYVSAAGIILSSMIAMFYGASTRTSEGDRLLYFPAVFFSLLIAGLIITIGSRTKQFLVLTAVVLTGAIIIRRTQSNWNMADAISKKILQSATARAARPLYLINVPGDYAGAFIFRNCFLEALNKHNIDTAGITIVNVISLTPGSAHKKIERRDDTTYIGAETQLIFKDGVIEIKAGKKILNIPETSAAGILFWNEDRFERLPADLLQR